MLLNFHEDVEKLEPVDIIASKYEWLCPYCLYLNHEIEVIDVVECDDCHSLYKTNLPEHAYS